MDLSELFDVAQANGDVEFPEYATGLPIFVFFSTFKLILFLIVSLKNFIFVDVMRVVDGYESLSKITTKYGQTDIFRFRDGRLIILRYFLIFSVQLI